MAPNHLKTTEDRVPSHRESVEVLSEKNTLHPSQAVSVACRRDKTFHNSKKRWGLETIEVGLFISQRQRREYISLQSLKNISPPTPSLPDSPWLTTVDYLNGQIQAVYRLGNRSSLSDVRLAVNASITGTRADLRRLNVVVVSAGVLDANLLDAANFDVLEGGGVAKVGVDAYSQRQYITHTQATRTLWLHSPARDLPSEAVMSEKMT
jgi:hypothetical protein